MSRFVTTGVNGNEIAFGFDRPLGEYFVQEFDPANELIIDLNSSGQSMVKNHEPMSNSAMYEAIVQRLTDRDKSRFKPQLSALLLDLPF